MAVKRTESTAREATTTETVIIVVVIATERGMVIGTTIAMTALVGGQGE